MLSTASSTVARLKPLSILLLSSQLCPDPHQNSQTNLRSQDGVPKLKRARQASTQASAPGCHVPSAEMHGDLHAPLVPLAPPTSQGWADGMGPCTPLFQHRLELKRMPQKRRLQQPCATHIKRSGRISWRSCATSRASPQLQLHVVSQVNCAQLWQRPCSCSDPWSRPGPQVKRTDTLETSSPSISETALRHPSSQLNRSTHIRPATGS